MQATQWKNQYWYSYNDYLTSHFGERVYKLTISAGFTCPTRDGTKGTRGCAFCDMRGSSSFFSSNQAQLEIRKQLERSMPHIRSRFGANKFIAYFQSYTNTYGPLSYLQEVYDGAITVPNIVGLAIGTRPDCLPNEVLDLLNHYGKSRYVCIELGVQSFRNESLQFYERGHSSEESIDAIQRIKRFSNIHISAHLMFGAPGETKADILAAAKTLNLLQVNGVKIHQLMVLKNTLLEEQFKLQPWELLSLENYNELAMTFLENLDKHIHVERTHAAASHLDELIGPTWSAQRFLPLNSLKQMMHTRCSYQGKNLAH